MSQALPDQLVYGTLFGRLRKHLPTSATRGQRHAARLAAAVCCGLLGLAALTCDEQDHAPYGSHTGAPPGGGGLPPVPDGGTDADADTDQDGGTDGCAEDEIAQPATDYCWLRCPLGQIWYEEYCDGSALLDGWTGAIAACDQVGGGHHLPSRAELLALFDNCEEQVAENQEGFCDSCGDSSACGSMFGYDVQVHWTSTDGEYSPWAVDFANGLVFMSDTEFDFHQVRCLRIAD